VDNLAHGGRLAREGCAERSETFARPPLQLFMVKDAALAGGVSLFTEALFSTLVAAVSEGLGFAVSLSSL
jgi:hypothetical protein